MTKAAPAPEFGAIVQQFQSGALEAASAAAAELLVLFPEDSRLWNLTASIFARLGETDAALDAYERSLAIDPGNARALNNRAVYLQQLKRFDAAEADARAGLELAPGDPEILNTLASVQILKGKYEDAEASLRAALLARPDYVEAQANLGRALSSMGRDEEAIVVLRAALSLKPDYLKAQVHLGHALVQLDRHAEAVEILRSVPDGLEESALAARNLSHAYEQLGDMDAAVAEAERALGSSPDIVAAYLLLARAGRIGTNDPRLKEMERLAASEAIGVRSQCELQFALGKVYDRDPGNEDAAFNAFLDGNRLRRRDITYSTSDDQAIAEAIKHRPNSPTPNLELNPVPIFVLGMPRSGTTLVEQILASHSRVSGGGEHGALNTAVDTVFAQNGVGFSTDNAKIAETYADLRPVADAGSDFLTDKTPFNFRWVGIIAEVFPDAPIIHTRRHPMAVAWSIYTNAFTERSMLFGYDFKEIASYYRMYSDLIEHWEQALPGRIYTIDYQSLTENQEAETRALLDYAGLPFEPGCLDFQKTKRVVRTASSIQVRKKMYTGSSDVWRRYDRHLQPLKDALGDVLDDWE